MIHYSCDRCKRNMNPDSDLRYVVKVEIHAAMDPADAEEIDDDRDYLLEIQDILERLEDEEDDAIGDDVYQKRRFDLCPDCFRAYSKNPPGARGSCSYRFQPKLTLRGNARGTDRVTHLNVWR